MEQIIDYKKILTYKDFDNEKDLERFQLDNKIEVISLTPIVEKRFFAPYGSDGYGGKTEPHNINCVRLTYYITIEVKKEMPITDVQINSQEYIDYNNKHTFGVYYDIIDSENEEHLYSKIEVGEEYFTSKEGIGTHFKSVKKIRISGNYQLK